jgi:hypothetical protein
MYIGDMNTFVRCVASVILHNYDLIKSAEKKAKTFRCSATKWAQKTTKWPWRHSGGIVVIASASGTEDLGFESRQGVRVLGLHTLQ